VQTLDRVINPDTSSNHLLRLALAILAIAVAIASDLQRLVFVYPFGVDLEIPLRAAQRWRAGGDPYLSSAFLAPPGATQPFLYPPYVLPPLTLIVDLPRMAVFVVWCAVCVGSLLFICHRLAFPAWSWPLVALWPPILEPMIGGNVQLPVVAMFCAVFWTSRRRRDTGFRPLERELDDPAEAGLLVGVLAALSAAVKVSQPHTWIAVLRRRPRLAIIGASLVVVGAVAVLPFTGIAIWGDWLDQLRQATDPSWELGGIAIARLVNPGLGLFVSIAAIAAILVVLPRRHTGAWVGVLGVVGASSLHLFGTLFLIPAMLIVRREIALVAAMLIGTTTYEGAWAGILIVAGGMLIGLHWPSVLEPEGTAANGTR
jgi:hypothetical protein